MTAADTNVVQLPQQMTITYLVAADVRAQFSWRKLTVRMLANHTARPYHQWRARIAGDVPMDVEDLAQLAEFMGCQPRDLLPATWPARRTSD